MTNYAGFFFSKLSSLTLTKCFKSSCANKIIHLFCSTAPLRQPVSMKRSVPTVAGEIRDVNDTRAEAGTRAPAIGKEKRCLSHFRRVRLRSSHLSGALAAQQPPICLELLAPLCSQLRRNFSH